MSSLLRLNLLQNRNSLHRGLNVHRAHSKCLLQPLSRLFAAALLVCGAGPRTAWSPESRTPPNGEQESYICFALLLFTPPCSSQGPLERPPLRGVWPAARPAGRASQIRSRSSRTSSLTLVQCQSRRANIAMIMVMIIAMTMAIAATMDTVTLVAGAGIDTSLCGRLHSPRGPLPLRAFKPFSLCPSPPSRLLRCVKFQSAVEPV